MGVLTHPDDELHESAVQAFPSLQLRADPVQEPPEHRSETVQASPSLHPVPSVSRVQLPVSVDVLVPQVLSPLQTGVVTSRLRVPVSSQVLLKPLQADHAPVVGEPQSASVVQSGGRVVSGAVSGTDVSRGDVSGGPVSSGVGKSRQKQ
jgi:hypothetical protein